MTAQPVPAQGAGRNESPRPLNILVCVPSYGSRPVCPRRNITGTEQEGDRTEFIYHTQPGPRGAPGPSGFAKDGKKGDQDYYNRYGVPGIIRSRFGVDYHSPVGTPNYPWIWPWFDFHWK